jgi:hypothetical protein
MTPHELQDMISMLHAWLPEPAWSGRLNIVRDTLDERVPLGERRAVIQRLLEEELILPEDVETLERA